MVPRISRPINHWTGWSALVRSAHCSRFRDLRGLSGDCRGPAAASARRRAREPRQGLGSSHFVFSRQPLTTRLAAILSPAQTFAAAQELQKSAPPPSGGCSPCAPKEPPLLPRRSDSLSPLSRAKVQSWGFSGCGVHLELCKLWGPFMKDLVIELVLIAMIVIPLIASSVQPCRAVPRKDAKPFRKLRRCD
jgi:hypothetical protein